MHFVTRIARGIKCLFEHPITGRASQIASVLCVAIIFDVKDVALFSETMKIAGYAGFALLLSYPAACTIVHDTSTADEFFD